MRSPNSRPLKGWIVLLKGFAYVWLTAAALVILAGIAGTWMKAGFGAVQDLLSPFNVVNWIVTVITLAPGLAALRWAEKLKATQAPEIATNLSAADVASWKFGLAELSRDRLTGLPNRGEVERQIGVFGSQQLGGAQAEPVTLIYVDLDCFKMLNEGFGRAAGDSVLRLIATVLQKQIDSGDLVARSGDDEFAVWLPGTSLADGMKLAERIRRAVETGGWTWNGSRYPVTVSCGVAAYPESVEDVNKISGTVESALLRAKQEGRNRVEQATPYLR